MTASLSLTATGSTKSKFDFSINETTTSAGTDTSHDVVPKQDIPDRTVTTK